MSTQSSSNQIELHFPNPEKSLQFHRIEESESDNLFHDHIQGEDENDEVVQMADHLRPMEELLRIPIVGIENAIVVPAVLADQFELKPELLDFISNNSFFGLENDDPHSHIRRFYQITRTLRLNQVLDDVVKLILFLFSLKGAAKTWLENEPPCSITTWDDLVSKLSQSDQDSLNTAAVSSSGGTSTQIDAITALTKQVKALEYHFASMRETYDRNQGAPIQLMQNQMGQMAEDLQERPLGVLPSNTVTDPLAELNVITSMDGLTLDGSFTSHSNLLVYQEKEQEPETITEVVEIASSKSTPLVPPPETPPLSTPKPKENLEPNPHQPLISYPSRLQEEKFQALENPTGRADHFVYRIDNVDSLCDKFPIKNNSLSSNPTPSSDFVVESLSTLPIPYEDSDSLVEETDTLLSHFDNSSPEYETFSFDIKEKSSGSTTTHSDYSLSDYEAFYFDDDHIEEKSSGSTTTHSDFSLPEYDSLIFDLSIDPLPPADRSDFYHEEFADELAHIISPPEYDYFYFDLEADPGEFTSVLEKNIFDLTTKDFTCIELNDSSLLLYNCDSSLSKEFFEMDLLVSFPSGNEDIVFDPGIIIKGVQFQRFQIPLKFFSTISFESYPLIMIDSPEIDTLTSFPSGNEEKVFNPGILTSKGFHSRYSLGLSH
ncbi:hypothetical protein Tco_0307747 [Tanacetum coccineum]